MSEPDIFNPAVFSAASYEKLKRINAGIDGLELYEFRYGLNDLMPENGWACVTLDAQADIEQRVNRRDFYDAIQIKPRVDDRIVLDPAIVRLTNMLCVGLITGAYSETWINAHFYFDIRGFYFLHRTTYFTDAEFGERACARGSLGILPAKDIMPLALANAQRLAKFSA